MVSLLWLKQEFTSGISVSKMAVKTLKKTNAPDVPAHQQLIKTRKKWKKWLWTIAESQLVADDVGISIGSCHDIFSNVLGMKRVAVKFVPKLLNFEQKQRRMEVAQESLTMPQPPYSPDMAPCDFFLFPKIKRTLKGCRFTAIDDIKSALLKELKAILKIEFEKCFED